MVCGTNLEEYAPIHNVPGQRFQARVWKLDGDYDGWHVGSTAGKAFER